MKFKLRVGVLAAASMVAFGLPANAATTASQGGDSGTVLDAVSVATEDMVPGVGAHLLASDEVSAAIADHGEGYEVRVPVEAAQPITVLSPEHEVEIGIPVDPSVEGVLEDTGATVFHDQEANVSVVVEPTTDGGVRQSFVLEGPTSETSFSVPVELTAGATLQLEADGSVSARTHEGELFGGFAAPWAVDAEGNDIATSFAVTDEGLVQEVEITENTAFPVVADPWWGIQYKISSKSANRLAALLNGGAGVSGIVAAICGGSIVGIPCGVAYGVAAGLLAIGGAVVSWCNSKGKGININKPWVGPIYCTSR